jgi:hypothetical protein
MDTIARIDERGRHWLMNRPDNGWAEDGLPYPTLAALLAAEPAYQVGGVGRDEHSAFVRLVEWRPDTCSDRIEPPLERRPGNALCIEIGQPLQRCRQQTPEHWNGHDAGATRWLLSGGSPFVLGLCSPATCPKMRG